MYKRYLLGILFKILALTCFCSMSLGFERIKFSNLNSIEQFAIICIIGVLLLLPIIITKYRKELLSSSIKLYPLRSFLGVLGMITWMEAVKHFGSTESIIVNYLTPIIAISFAAFFKQERLSMVCMFVGVLCYYIIFHTLKKKISISEYGFVMAFISSCLWAIYEVICKKQSNNEHFLVQAFYTILFATIFLLPVTFRVIHTISFDQFIVLTGLSILRIVNIVLLFLSIKFATLNWLLPVSYLKFPIMTLLSFLFLNTNVLLDYWVTIILLIIINIGMVKIRHKLRYT